MKSKTIKILALLLTACVVLGVASCSSMGGGEEETTEPRSESAVPLDTLSNNEAIIQYFNVLMAQLNSDKVKAKLTYSSDYDPNSFECDNSVFAAALPTLTKLMKDGFNADLGAEVEFGTNFADYIPVKNSNVPLVLSMADVAIFEAAEDADENEQKKNGKPMIAVNEEAFSRFEEASSRDAEAMKNDPKATTEYVEVDEDVRKITITLKDETDPQAGQNLFGEIYNIPDRAKIKAEMDKLSNYVTYDGTYKATYTGCSIYMEVDRITNQVIKLEFHRNIEVEVQVTGNPNNPVTKDLGTTTLKFKVNGADRYEFDYNDPNAQSAE